jgi:hypothetical protein
MRFRIISNSPSPTSVRPRVPGSGTGAVGVSKTPVVPLENDAICKSNGTLFPQVRLLQVIESPPPMALTTQVVEPDPGPLP